MAQDTSYIRQFFEGIRDERGTYQNTATRIGTAFLLLLDYLASIDYPYLRKDIDDTAEGRITFLKGITAHLESLFEGLTFQDILKSEGASDGNDGTGIYMDATTGTISTGGLNVRGWMSVAKLVYNMIQVMEQDYQFSGGGDIERVVANVDGTYTLHIHKEKEDRHTSFGDFDILYGKVDELQESGQYYTSWMRVCENGVTLNEGMTPDTVRVELWDDAQVPGGRNFSPKDMMTVARRGNTRDEQRQQFWELSTTDQRLAFYWHVDNPIISDEHYALCLGMLPDLACLPANRDRNLPSLYVNTVFAEDVVRIKYPAPIEKTDRGEWSATPTAIYEGFYEGLYQGVYYHNGDTIPEPYHCRSCNFASFLNYRLDPSWSHRSDDEIRELLQVQRVSRETSRVWVDGILWECQVEGTTEVPRNGCHDWVKVGGVASSYEVDFSGYVDVITIDDAGNCIGGLYSDSGSNHRSYRIHSAISVRKNGSALIFTPPSSGNDDTLATEGHFKIYGEGHGCSFVIEDSTLYITAIDNIKDGVPGSPDDVDFDYEAMRQMSSCSVDLIIDCEGVTNIQKHFPVTIKHDSQPYVYAELSVPMSSVNWNGSSYAGLPISFDIRMWHNNERIDFSSADDIVIRPSIPGLVVSKSIINETVDEGTDEERTYRMGRVVISELPPTLQKATRLEITCAAVYSGVSYERTLSHLITKLSDGVSVSSYIYSQEAWGDSADEHPQTGWSESTPAKNGKYLWRRTRKMVLTSDGTGYEPETDIHGVAIDWQYHRLDGINGTSIETKGTVETTAFLLDGYVRPYINGQTVPLADKVAVSDGWSYVCKADGHLYQWNDEVRSQSGTWVDWRSGWLDLEKYKGDDGKTYFTHIAWASSVTLATQAHPAPSAPPGQMTTPNASSVGDFSIAPVPGYGWRGELVNETDSDPTNSEKLLYTWHLVSSTLYWLQPSTQTVSVGGDGSPTPQTFSVKLMKTEAGVTQELASIPQGLAQGMSIEVYVDGTLEATYSDIDNDPSSFCRFFGQGATSQYFAECSRMEFRLRARTSQTVYDTKTISTIRPTVGWRLEASVTHFRFIRDYAGVLTGTPASALLRVVKSEGESQTVYDTSNAVLPSDIHLGWISPNHQWASGPSLGVVTASTLMTYIGNTLFESTSIGLYKGGIVRSDYTVTGGTLIAQLTFTAEVAVHRMLVPAGRYVKNASPTKTWQLTDRTCPLVLYGDRYFSLAADSASTDCTTDASNEPKVNGTSKWNYHEDYEVVLTKMLFAWFAKMGGFVVYEDFFFSQYGTLFVNDGNTVEEIAVGAGNCATEYETGDGTRSVPYGFFSFSDPMPDADSTLEDEGRFRPALCMNAKTGEVWFAGGKVHMSPSGDVSVEGTIKANNLYRNVCLFRQDENYSNDCYYCRLAPSIDFTVGNYYTSEEIYDGGFTPGDTYQEEDTLNYLPYFIPTTYDADVVVMVPNVSQNNDGGWHTNRPDQRVLTPIWPMLPSPTDFIGKLVEVSGWSRVSDEKNIHVGCVIYNAMSNGIEISNGAFVFAPAADEIVIKTGAVYKFLSMTIGNATRWVLLGK